MKKKYKKIIKINKLKIVPDDYLLANFAYLIPFFLFSLFGKSEYTKSHIKIGKNINLMKIIFLILGIFIREIISKDIRKYLLIPIFIFIMILEILSLFGIYCTCNGIKIEFLEK